MSARDIPILFSSSMVQALIREAKQPGTGKTQTRRLLTADSLRIWTGGLDYPGSNVRWPQTEFDEMLGRNAREFRIIDGIASWKTDPAQHQRGAVFASWQGRLSWECGDRLWVREAWQGINTVDGPQLSYRATPDYFPIDAWDGPDEGAGPSFNYDRCPGTDFAVWGSDLISDDGPWRPGIHMPRWASRLTLTVADVRVERLQDISDDDAVAEGCPGIPGTSPRNQFRELWEGLNATRGGASWSDNPWLIALTFSVALRNIDADAPSAQVTA